MHIPINISHPVRVAHTQPPQMVDAETAAPSYTSRGPPPINDMLGGAVWVALHDFIVFFNQNKVNFSPRSQEAILSIAHSLLDNSLLPNTSPCFLELGIECFVFFPLYTIQKNIY